METTRIPTLSEAARLRALPAVLLAALLLAGCPAGSPLAPADAPLDPEAPASWVKPERWSGSWVIWADVRDFVGEERWATLDTAWMEERARADLDALTPEDDYADEFLLSGLWRMGLHREAVLAALAAREPDAAWPLQGNDRRICFAWRPRLERWMRTQPQGIGGGNLGNMLDASWREAVAGEDLKLAARVVEAREACLGEGTADDLAPAAEKLVRAALARIEAEAALDWRDARVPRGLVRLMERFGVPEGVDLAPIAATALHRFREIEHECIPLPHPYDLNLTLLLLERLRDR